MPDVQGSSQTPLDEVFPDPDFLSPKVLISVAVEEGQTYDADDWKEWLLDCPAVARGMWVEVTSPRKPTASGTYVSSDSQATLPDKEAVVNIGIDLIKFVFGFIKPHRPIKAYSDMSIEAYDPRGHTLSILGLDGFGLGLTIAQIANDLLGMKIAYHHGGGKSPAQEPYVDATFYPNLDHMLRRTDCLLIIALPQGSTDAVMDNKCLIALLPCGSRLVRIRSTNRIDQDVLADALSSGHLASAGLDRSESEPHFSEKLVAMRNVEITNQNRGPTRISEEIVEESPTHVGLQAVPTFSDASVDVDREDPPASVPEKVVLERVNKAAEDLSEASSKKEVLPPSLDTILHAAPSDPSSVLSRSNNPGVSAFPRASGSTKQTITPRKLLEWFRKPFHTDSGKRHEGKDPAGNRK
ncbi:MAG: hypothetical protein Q9226_007860 [Calogaya cf. arnoldii]